jgi:4-hydroxy-4-methyl-2-oxoglutarate aldolase
MRRALLVCFAAALALAQQQAQRAKPQAPFSKQYLKVEQHSVEEDARLIKLFEDMRVTDVSDGLDVAGLQDLMLMDPNIRPLWRDGEKFTHRICGTALTIRTVPAQERAPNFPSHEEFAKWESNWYRTKVPGDFAERIHPGTILVIDAGTRDDGMCGSNNALGWFLRGMRGIVTSGGCRDSDELILQKLPVYQKGGPLGTTRGIDPGRQQIESYNQPVSVGRVLVMPGDIIVGDVDGVAVVPRAKAEVVAAAARKILDGDKAGRRRLYQRAGWPEDFTVK